MWTGVEEGDHKYADKRTQEAIAAGIDPRVILDDGLFPGFNLQGDRFTAQIIFIPEMLITARAMKAGLKLIRPLLAANKEKPTGTFIMGTVLGDMDDQISLRRMQAIAERWRPWRTVATWYLWRSLDPVAVEY